MIGRNLISDALIVATRQHADAAKLDLIHWNALTCGPSRLRIGPTLRPTGALLPDQSCCNEIALAETSSSLT